MSPEERAKALVDWCASDEGTAAIVACAGGNRYAFVPKIAAVIREAELAERERCAAVALADLEGVPGEIVPAKHRFDNGASERTARRIAEAIRRGVET